MKFRMFSDLGVIETSGITDPNLFADTYELGVAALFEGLTPNAWDEQAGPVLLETPMDGGVVEGGEKVPDPSEEFTVGDRVLVINDEMFECEGKAGTVESIGYGLVNVEIDGTGEAIRVVPFLPNELEILDPYLFPAPADGTEEWSIESNTFTIGDYAKVVKNDCDDSGAVYGLTGRIVEGPVDGPNGDTRWRLDFSKDGGWDPEDTMGLAWFFVDEKALTPFYPGSQRAN